MSIVSVAVSGTEPRTGRTDGKTGTVKVYLQIIVDDPTDNQFTIESSSFFPPYLSPLSSNPFFTRRGVSIENTHPWAGWTAALDYSSEPLTDRERDKAEENPLSRKAIYTWSQQQFQQSIDADRNGHATTNSAGDYFDPPPEKQDARWLVTCEKNLQSVPLWFLEYMNAVNEADFALDGVTVPKECALLTGITISEQLEENNQSYRRVQMAFELRPPKQYNNLHGWDGNLYVNVNEPADGWDFVALDQGFRRIKREDENGQTLPPDEHTKVNITDDEGELITTPQLLDGAGEPLSATNRTPNKAHYIRYKIYTPRDFSQLPLT